MIKKAYPVVVLILALFSITAFAVTCSDTDNEVTNDVSTETELAEPVTEQVQILQEEPEPEPEEPIEEDTTVVSETQSEAEITSNVTTDTTSNTTEKPIETESSSYTDDDLFYLAAAVCREAGGESEEIQLLVANVVINRVNSSIYPNTIEGVLTQYKQYGTMWKYGISFPKWADASIKEQCYKVAQRILDGERVCPENVLFQAEFKQGSGVYKEFDGFYFCYYG